MQKASKRVLLVEDELTIALIESKQLEHGGYDVVRATSGEEAVRIATNGHSIDMVLMDIDLGSGIPGTEAARQILSKRSLPVVFLTSHCEKHIVETVKGITRYGYILKGAGPFVLLEQVATAFELFEARRELEETNRRYRFVADHTSDAVLVLEGETFTYASPAIEKLLGYPAEKYKEQTFHSILDWIHPGERDSLRAEMTQMWSHRKERSEFTFRALRVNNTYRLIEDHVTCTYDSSGGLQMMVQSLRDVTELRLRERVLKENLVGITSRFHSIAENAPGIVFELRQDMRGNWSIPYVNRGGRTDTYLTDSYLDVLDEVDDPGAVLGSVHPDDRLLVQEEFARSRRLLQTCELTHRLISADGAIRWLFSRSTPRLKTDGSVHWTGLAVDVTAQKEAESRLRDALEEKSRLMRELHHRVKNNLAMVHGLLSIKAATLGDEVDLSDTIAQVNAILTAHRLLTVDSEQNEVDLPGYLHDLISTLFQLEKHVKWSINCAPIRLTASAAVTLGLIVNELGVNAIKHAFSHDDWFSIAGNVDEEQLHLTVSHSGTDLPEDFSLENGANLGLGLSLMKGLVRQLRGTTRVDRNPTAFRFDIPVTSLVKEPQ